MEAVFYNPQLRYRRLNHVVANIQQPKTSSSKLDDQPPVSFACPTLFCTDDGIKLRTLNPAGGNEFQVLNCDIHVWNTFWVSEINHYRSVVFVYIMF